MGREIRRVPLDFNWPLHKVWQGFLNPYFSKCLRCSGTGSTLGSRWLDKWLGEFEKAVCCYPMEGKSWVGIQAKELQELFCALSGVKIDDTHFRTMATYSIREKLLEIAGLPGWGRCTACDSTGIDAEVKAKYDAWEEEPPPEGEGWQLWETVSEGSPISPVFPTKETFVDYLVGQGYSREAAINFSESGWAPTLVQTGGKFLRDIESCR
jgi:hypothetical protein